MNLRQPEGKTIEFGMTCGNPDFVAYARAHRVKGSRQGGRRSRADARSGLCGDVHLVVAPVDYAENSRVLLEELRAHTANHGEQQ